MYISIKELLEQIKLTPVKGQAPTLTILKQGDSIDSNNYIKSILDKAEKLNIKIIVQDLEGIKDIPAKIKELQELCEFVLPVKPFEKEITETLKETIDKSKDIDNFTGSSLYKNCTVEAVERILNFLNINKQKHIVVLGRNLGMEIVKDLVKNNYTIAGIGHTGTNCKSLTLNADVIISCTGKKDIIGKGMVKVNSTIIDVGLGDVQIETITKANVTSVRNGVGTLTTLILLNRIIKGGVKK